LTSGPSRLGVPGSGGASGGPQPVGP